MGQIKDIREYKRNLRTFYKEKRNALTTEQKQKMDEAVLQRVKQLHKFQNAKLILTYVSTPIEVDTRALIRYALESGKQVAVPRCVENTREMEFYLIRSLEELKPRTFGVDEPEAVEANKVKLFQNSVCIVPGLCFDRQGYRLGYGKGYYDRFLSNYHGPTIGLCYHNCIKNKLIFGRFDRASDTVVTDRFVIRAHVGRKNQQKGNQNGKQKHRFK